MLNDGRVQGAVTSFELVVHNGHMSWKGRGLINILDSQTLKDWCELNIYPRHLKSPLSYGEVRKFTYLIHLTLFFLLWHCAKSVIFFKEEKMYLLIQRWETCFIPYLYRYLKVFVTEVSKISYPVATLNAEKVVKVIVRCI